MLAAHRPYNNTIHTENMIASLPSWMKIHEDDSTGRRFLNSAAGMEMSLFARTLSEYSDYLNVMDAPTSMPTKFYEMNLEYPLTSGIVYSIEPSCVIRTTDDIIHFLTNPVTRLEPEEDIVLTGTLGNFAGLEWFGGYPSGYLIAQFDVNPITPSSTMYYDVRITDNHIILSPASGDALGLGYVGLKQNASFEVVRPESSGSLVQKYPEGLWTSPTGALSEVPAGHETYESYSDPTTKEKIYRYAMLNNPYGSGVYNKSDVTTVFHPISGSLDVFDIMNLTSSGTPTWIDPTGQAMYTFSSGNFTYVGYQNTVPSYLCADPNISGQTATSIGSTSFALLNSSGYVDTEVFPYTATFDWNDGTGPFTNVVRFTNPQSAYQIEYQYKLFDNIGHLGGDGKDGENVPKIGDSDLHFLDTTDKWSSLSTEPSESVDNARRVDVIKARPGSVVKATVTFNTQVRDRWEDITTQSKTIQLQNHNIGYTDSLGSP